MTAHPIDTEALRRLADQATPGPWETSQTADEETTTWIEHHCGDVLNHDERGHGHMRENFAWMKRADADFIAAARTAVPALLDENAALRARIKAVEDVLGESEARGPVGMTFNGTQFPAWISIATIRRALDGDA